MKDILVLADGTTVELESGSSLGSMKVLSVDKASMVETWDKFTDENLKTVQVKNGDGVVGNYSNLTLVSETSIIQNDGSILTKFNLREKSDMELDIEELKNDMQSINEAVGGNE